VGLVKSRDQGQPLVECQCENNFAVPHFTKAGGWLVIAYTDRFSFRFISQNLGEGLWLICLVQVYKICTTWSGTKMLGFGGSATTYLNDPAHVLDLEWMAFQVRLQKR
jgi:hypothetical protein